ncbi:MAG: enoyl-CoA hydratase [Alphaproteobacteria bacterium]|nr:enoyl-CoA hydratase [Alphaproteobacteria bacterium]
MKSYAEGKMLAEVEDGIGLITFNQPEKRNAMSVNMWHGLTEILDDFEGSDAVRAVVMTGAGHKAFVSGADISQFEQQRANANAQLEYDRLTSAGRARLAGFPKPVIARIRGFCLGGGLGIAMQADVRIAAVDSEFGIPAAKLGIAYGFDMVRKLVSLVGQAHARTMLFTGSRIDAAEAGRIGLVNQVVEDEDLNTTVYDLARTIADNAPLSVKAMKMAVNGTIQTESERDLDAINAAVLACFDSEDYREGRTAFMEKRKPAWKGR